MWWVVLCGTNWSEDAGEEHEDRDDRDDVDFIGTSNGTKADEPDETGDADKDKDSAAEKPPATDADTSTKELEPDFTVTPSKDSQSAAYTDTYLYILNAVRCPYVRPSVMPGVANLVANDVIMGMTS